jgi:hypothetical protein
MLASSDIGQARMPLTPTEKKKGASLLLAVSSSLSCTLTELTSPCVLREHRIHYVVIATDSCMSLSTYLNVSGLAQSPPFQRTYVFELLLLTTQLKKIESRASLNWPLRILKMRSFKACK